MTSKSQALRAGYDLLQARDTDSLCSKFGQRLLLHAVKIRVAARQADFHMGHRANQPVAHDLRGLMKGRNRALP